MSGFKSAPPPRPAEKQKSATTIQRTGSNNKDFGDTEGTSQTVLQQFGSDKGAADAPCKKCGEATGGAKFCPVCGELQGGPTGNIGGIMSPRAK